MITAVMAFFISFVSCHVALAGELTYTCKITHVYELNSKGSLSVSNWEKEFNKSEFSVSRVTGEISGKVIPTLLANSTKVINKGSKEYSFKSIAHFDSEHKPLPSGIEKPESTASVQLLEIQEFRKGEQKPFIAMSMGGAGIITGFCK